MGKLFEFAASAKRKVRASVEQNQGNVLKPIFGESSGWDVLLSFTENAPESAKTSIREVEISISEVVGELDCNRTSRPGYVVKDEKGVMWFIPRGVCYGISKGMRLRLTIASEVSSVSFTCGKKLPV